MNTQLISKYLQALRKENNLTQEALAKELNITRQAVPKWETGNTLPDIESLLLLSKLYKVSINDILEPRIPPRIIEDFEQITEVPLQLLEKTLSAFTQEDIAKAAMGASPGVNEFLAHQFPDVDFKKVQEKIGRIRVSEVEDIQSQITAFINLYFPV